MAQSNSKQIDTWTGDFGVAYLERNRLNADLLRKRTMFFGKIAKILEGRAPGKILEVGSNVGINLAAIRQVFDAELTAVEPFDAAREELTKSGILPPGRIHKAVGKDLPFADGSFDLAFTSGVLIHVNPDDVAKTIDEVVRVSRRFVLCIEYFAPKQEEIIYHGQGGLLFRNDFGGIYMDRHPELELMEYGFLWRRVSSFDDCVWWLFEKKQG